MRVMFNWTPETVAIEKLIFGQGTGNTVKLLAETFCRDLDIDKPDQDRRKS